MSRMRSLEFGVRSRRGIMMETMQAVRIHKYGEADVLQFEEAPKPQPGKGEILIRVHAAGVNPVDWKIREGYLKIIMHHKFPLILGWDVSGVIEAVGAGVNDFKEGDEVYSRPDISRDGAYAEYIAVNASEAAHKPKSINHIKAAAVPLAALTAWQSLFDAADLKAGQRVLIHAAAGGVGHFAVQLAKWKGAYVIGTASQRNSEFLRDLGIDEVVNYTTKAFEEGVRDVDVVFDTIGGDVQRRSWKTLKRGGVLVSITDPISRIKGMLRSVRGKFVFVQPNANQLSEIAQLIDRGRLRPIVETSLPLVQAAQAQSLSQKGHVRGKLVLRVRD